MNHWDQLADFLEGAKGIAGWLLGVFGLVIAGLLVAEFKSSCGVRADYTASGEFKTRINEECEPFIELAFVAFIGAVVLAVVLFAGPQFCRERAEALRRRRA